MLLVFAPVFGQNDAGGGGGEVAEGAQEDGAGDEEAWQYVEFLKTDVK
jgi:hypothetical protein